MTHRYQAGGYWRRLRRLGFWAMAMVPVSLALACAGRPLPPSRHSETAAVAPAARSAHLLPQPAEALVTPDGPADQPYPRPEVTLEDIVAQAERLLAEGAVEQAIAEATSALRRDEKYVPAMAVLARANFALGKDEFAEAICDIALGLQNNLARCYNLKGFVALKADDAPLALAHFLKATDVDPDYGPGWLNVGAQHLRAKRYQAALAALERATERLPERPEAFLNLGSAYRGVGDLIRAQQAYHRALELRPAYAAATFNLGILYLDAATFPGIERLRQLEIAQDHLLRYRELTRYRDKTGDADVYLKEVDTQLKREQRRIERDKLRQAPALAPATE